MVRPFQLNTGMMASTSTQPRKMLLKRHCRSFRENPVLKQMGASKEEFSDGGDKGDPSERLKAVRGMAHKRREWEQCIHEA